MKSITMAYEALHDLAPLVSPTTVYAVPLDATPCSHRPLYSSWYMPGMFDSRLCIHCSLDEILFPLIVTLLVSSLHSDVIHANVTCLL